MPRVTAAVMRVFGKAFRKALNAGKRASERPNEEALIASIERGCSAINGIIQFAIAQRQAR